MPCSFQALTPSLMLTVVFFCTKSDEWMTSKNTENEPKKIKNRKKKKIDGGGGRGRGRGRGSFTCCPILFFCNDQLPVA